MSKVCTMDDLYPGQVVRLLQSATFWYQHGALEIPKGRIVIVLTEMICEGDFDFKYGQFLVSSKGCVAVLAAVQPVSALFEIVE